MGLPRLNGYDACRAIRAQANGRRVRIVALTGWGKEEDRSKSQAAGFDMHLVSNVTGRTIDEERRKWNE